MSEKIYQPEPYIEKAVVGGARPHGIASVSKETRVIDGVERECEVTVYHQESFQPGSRMRYPKSKMGWFHDRGAGGAGIWTGCQGDFVLLKMPLTHTKPALKFLETHSSLVDAPWQVIGRRNLYRAVRAVKTFREDKCPIEKTMDALDPPWLANARKEAEMRKGGVQL